LKGKAAASRRTPKAPASEGGRYKELGMAKIIVMGVGPGATSHLTKEVETELLRADKIFFRTGAHPVYEWLREQGKHLVCFDKLYDPVWTNPGDIYEFMVAALFKEAELRGEAVYAVPGSPDVLEETTNLIRVRGANEGVEVRVLPGVSFLDQVLGEIKHNFFVGLQVVLPLTHLQHGLFNSRMALMVCQIEARSNPLDRPRVDLTMESFLKAYPPEHVVTLLWTDGLPDYKTQKEHAAEEFGAGIWRGEILRESVRATGVVKISCLSVQVVGGAEPCFQLGVNIGRRRDFDTVRDAIFFGEATGVDEALGESAFVGGEAEAKIDSGVGGGLNLGENVFAIQRDRRFARAGFDVGAERLAE
jgi:hypothetical protein